MQILVVFIVSNILLSKLIPFIENQLFSTKLGVDKIICCTYLGNKKDIKAIDENITFVGNNLISEYSKEGNIKLIPVEEEYFKCLNYPFSKYIASHSSIRAIVPKSLSKKYSIGEKYCIETNDNEQIEFEVAGVLSKDYMFIPPTSSAAVELVGEVNDAVFLLGDNLSDYFDKSNVYMLYSNNPHDKVITELYGLENMAMVMSGREGMDYYLRISLEMLGLPIVLFIVVVFLCIAGVISNVFLSVKAFERKYSICYLCGYSLKNCLVVQFLTDLFVFLAALIFSVCFLWALDDVWKNDFFQMEFFFISCSIIFLIYICAELIGYVQMKKIKFIEVIERVK